MTNKETRFSGIELLRLFCIYTILLSHYSVLGNDLDNIVNLNNCLDPAILYMQESTMFSRLACSVFVLITGYFSVLKEDSIFGQKSLCNHYLKAILICTEMFFYSVLILLFSIAFHTVQVHISDIIKSLLPWFYGNWYIKSFLCLYLLIPFMNKAILKIDQKTLCLFIIVYLLVWSLIPTLNGRAWDHYGNFDMMFIMYIIGAYIRLYSKDIILNRGERFFLVLIIFLHLLSVPCFDLIGKWTGNEYFCRHAMFLREYSTVTSVLIAIGFFIIFKDFKFKSRLINEAARGVLGVYLIHLDPLINDILWNGVWSNRNYLNNPWFHLPAKCAVILLSCLLIDFLRRKTIAVVGYPIIKHVFVQLYGKVLRIVDEKHILPE